MATSTQAYPLPNCARLSDDNLTQVQRVANKCLQVWTSPQLSPEARLYFIDDVAVLFMAFGLKTLESAIDWYRQNHQRTSRPTIREVRDRCSEIAGSKRRPLSDEMNNYFAELKNRPQDFVPVALIMRDAMNLSALKRAREKVGNPMSREEVKAWFAKRNADTRAEWADMVRIGKHLAPAPVDVKRRATGEQEMTRLL